MSWEFAALLVSPQLLALLRFSQPRVHPAQTDLATPLVSSHLAAAKFLERIPWTLLARQPGRPGSANQTIG